MGFLRSRVELQLYKLGCIFDYMDEARTYISKCTDIFAKLFGERRFLKRFKLSKRRANRTAMRKPPAKERSRVSSRNWVVSKCELALRVTVSTNCERVSICQRCVRTASCVSITF